jgi:hypothetical protein
MKPLLLIILILVLIIVVPVLTGVMDRRRILRLIQGHGGQVLELEPALRPLFSSRYTSYWRVTYRAADGSIRRADCTAGPLRCKLEEEQVLQTGQQRLPRRQ